MEKGPLEARILVIGSLNVDFIITVSHHPASQDHVQGCQDETQPGGHGANQAVACARLSRHDPGTNSEANFISDKANML
jgi:ribokinase